MLGHGPAVISAVIEHLKREDIELLLANRGIPSLGSKQELTERLQAALTDEICEWEWETGDVPNFHAEIIGAGSTLVTHNNCIYAFGGMDEERTEHMFMWKWDLSTDEGFLPVAYRGQVPNKLASGHYAVVHEDELWVFPGPRNHNMRKVYCLDLLRYRWVERSVIGEPAADAHSRRNLDCFMLDDHRMGVFGGPLMDKLHIFTFASRTWSKKMLTGGLPSWTFGHATLHNRALWAFGTLARASEEGPLEVWQLDIASLRWKRVVCGGHIPYYRIHSSAAVVGDKWIVHGGRRPGKFNVSNNTHVFDFETCRWSVLMAEGMSPIAREWQTAIGLQDCMVVVGGRIEIPEYEPIPISCDTMATAVEILWYRAPPNKQQPTGNAVLLSSVRDMFNSPHLSDITLVVEGRRVPAHRHVLATHSPVFEAMFQQCLDGSKMREVETHQVHISDLRYDTVMLLLRYMYGCLQDFPRHHTEVIELFRASDKYDVRGLVKECVQVFRKITRADHLAPLLQVADEHDSEELRSVCMDIASTCLPDMVVAPSFQQLMHTNPGLGCSFIREVSLKLNCPSQPPAESEPASPSQKTASEAFRERVKSAPASPYPFAGYQDDSGSPRRLSV
ncbi:hypothetical protein WJX72_003488 [[Myrmecia] bisecta]|uniref:BTB domain-containing protein n=1 Tax=[Myrmecia] bisecta TaxID=41462 RepID=A0AAW1R5H1_9CHLO